MISLLGYLKDTAGHTGSDFSLVSGKQAFYESSSYLIGIEFTDQRVEGLFAVYSSDGFHLGNSGIFL